MPLLIEASLILGGKRWLLFDSGDDRKDRMLGNVMSGSGETTSPACSSFASSWSSLACSSLASSSWSSRPSKGDGDGDEALNSQVVLVLGVFFGAPVPRQHGEGHQARRRRGRKIRGIRQRVRASAARAGRGNVVPAPRTQVPWGRHLEHRAFVVPYGGPLAEHGIKRRANGGRSHRRAAHVTTPGRSPGSAHGMS